MALAIQAESTRLQVAAGYESGHTMVFVQSDPGAQFQRLYCARPHSQPGLSPPPPGNVSIPIANIRVAQSSPWPFCPAETAT